MEADERVTLEFDALAFGGEAVGRDPSGRVIFAFGGAPGDRAEVRITASKKRYARGVVVQILKPGAARVVASCRFANRCGGCPWQHVAPVEQLAAKQDFVARALGRTGAQVAPIVPAPAWLGYRSRVKMTARGGAIGYQAWRSHEVIDVDHCPALEPPLDLALQAARREFATALGEGATLAGLVGGPDRIHLSLVSGEGADRQRLIAGAGRLLGSCGIRGILLDGELICGEPTIAVDPGAPFNASAAGFAQANRVQNEVLRQLVAQAAGAADLRVLELYAGDGNFTRDLAAVARAVVAVEADGLAARRLLANLNLPGAALQRVSVRHQSAARAVRDLADRGEPIDLVLLDPPRAGAFELLDDLARLSPARMVYVSCDPMTLGRDVTRLEVLGYQVVSAQPIDLMPHAAHVEIVCTLIRRLAPPLLSVASRE